MDTWNGFLDAYIEELDFNVSFLPLQQLFLKHAHVQKALSPGRVVVLFTERYHHCLAVVLQSKGQQSYTAKAKHQYTVLMLCNRGDESEDAAPSLVSLDSNIVRPYVPMERMFRPDGEIRHTVVEVSAEHLVCLTGKELNVDGNRIISDYRQRQIPRFKWVLSLSLNYLSLLRDSPPGRDTSRAVQELLLLVDAHTQGGLHILDPVRELKVTDMEYVEMRDERNQLVHLLSELSCRHCPLFEDHVSITWHVIWPHLHCIPVVWPRKEEGGVANEATWASLHVVWG